MENNQQLELERIIEQVLLNRIKLIGEKDQLYTGYPVELIKELASAILSAGYVKLEEQLRLREYLWLSHGHQGLYGDDGELQCGECRADYKRDDLDILIKKAMLAREEINLKVITSKEKLVKLSDVELSDVELDEEKIFNILCPKVLSTKEITYKDLTITNHEGVRIALAITQAKPIKVKE